MPHFRLQSPANPSTTLTKRGSSWDSPIYHCTVTNTFWMLHMDRQGHRYLYEYKLGGARPVIDKSKKHPVPEDWTGDPETVYVTLESIVDAQSSFDAANLPSGLQQLLDNGDRVLVTDYDNSVIGEIVKSGNSLRLDRRGGFEIS